jgi:hypothetical protein
MITLSTGLLIGGLALKIGKAVKGTVGEEKKEENNES